MSKPMAPGVTTGTHAGGGEVVAIELDVEHAGIDGALLDAGDQLAQPLGQRNAAALDADQRQVFAAVALLNNLVGQAHQGTLDLRGGHQPALDAQAGMVWLFAHGFSRGAVLSLLVSRRMIRGVGALRQVVENWMHSRFRGMLYTSIATRPGGGGERQT